MIFSVIAFLAFDHRVVPVRRHFDQMLPFGVLAVKQFTEMVALGPGGKLGISIKPRTVSIRQERSLSGAGTCSVSFLCHSSSPLGKRRTAFAIRLGPPNS